jgi:hypothetical protein
MSWIAVLFPAPECPTNATFSPAFILILADLYKKMRKKWEQKKVE